MVRKHELQLCLSNICLSDYEYFNSILCHIFCKEKKWSYTATSISFLHKDKSHVYSTCQNTHLDPVGITCCSHHFHARAHQLSADSSTNARTCSCDEGNTTNPAFHGKCYSKAENENLIHYVTSVLLLYQSTVMLINTEEWSILYQKGIHKICEFVIISHHHFATSADIIPLRVRMMMMMGMIMVVMALWWIL